MQLNLKKCFTRTILLAVVGSFLCLFSSQPVSATTNNTFTFTLTCSEAQAVVHFLDELSALVQDLYEDNYITLAEEQLSLSYIDSEIARIEALAPAGCTF
jgi:hypothetical protein